MVFNRPNRPNKPSQAIKKPTQSAPKKVITTGGNQGGNNSNNPPPPSPWLDPNNEPSPHETASFVEYLRWMREPDRDNYKDGTKVQMLNMATERANYRQRLTTLVKRTELIAGKNNTFQVKCPWRIRVGGHRGPESILLPAFDALGMPYLPSSTLRGAARNQAIRELIAEKKLDWKAAQNHPEIAKYFGSLEAQDKDKAGKVIFLDAYPLPSQGGGLAMDMANNIWKWEDNSPGYSPNPNPFLSLKEPTFVIGLKLGTLSNDPKVLDKVKNWLIKGLQAGIGSQINTGYGLLLKAGAGQPKQKQEFLRVEFALEGQLIHGHQRFTQWQFNDRRQEWQMRGQPQAEVRPTAFKSMLRYWFRAFALGVLEPSRVQTLESELFGGINPTKQYGYLQVNILDGRIAQKEPRPNYQGKNDPCGEQQGTLVLSFSPAARTEQAQNLKTLFTALTWLMFNLGGIGQGARRPCYSRKTRENAPWFRGSTFYIEEEDNKLWVAPEQISAFKTQFQGQLKEFYRSLGALVSQQLNYNRRRNDFPVSQQNWTDAVDANCEIIICNGKDKNDKPYALSILHSPQLKIQQGPRQDYDGNLCGKVAGGVKPSPVWIADLGDYQVVTVFGANQNPRRQYLEELKRQTSAQNYVKVFPLP
ncbi:type III-B CRISPR module RAMP protein Cmr6 [Spirulina subsalsa FACHB-351]|uniref:Type III-B CRISPR module RAMP protein Cmr6 n=1 Tax=Spirulina subsalsa FACHB-351 TaxID=234711 RepID=A0ABT3L6W4_9CYAN|nr:RAMP superfamily CRISPR-associated protein [Spirulina subsalsa]MCW6036927.1 type III-B CRISPR module RAMP protein Cmr6 [Spirulina subsalsa FACHB-351]